MSLQKYSSTETQKDFERALSRCDPNTKMAMMSLKKMYEESLVVAEKRIEVRVTEAASRKALTTIAPTINKIHNVIEYINPDASERVHEHRMKQMGGTCSNSKYGNKILLDD